MMLGSSLGAAGRGAGRVAGAARAAVPLLVLGLARAVSVKATAYAEHVSEYGVHWNYFFTLAVVSMATALVANIITPRGMTAAGLVLLAGRFACRPVTESWKNL